MLVINAYLMLAVIPIYIYAVQRYNKIRTSQRERAIFSICTVEITQYALKRAEAPSPGHRPG